MRIKKLIAFVMAVVTLLLCTACGPKKWKNPELLEGQIVCTPVEPKPEVIRNPLTGEPMENPQFVNYRPTAVMLNNIHHAMPQHGVSQADIIFEFVVEHGITRMVGFFQDISIQGTIGSVRSARPYFVETVYGMEALYVHAGGSDEAVWMLYDLDMCHIDEIDFDCFWRDQERRQTMAFEHTLMTSGERLEAYFQTLHWNREHDPSWEYPFTYVEDGTPYGGTAATDVAVEFSSYKTGYFHYDSNTKRYMISQHGGEYIDGNTGEQVGVTNLLVLRTTVYNSGDSAGHMVIDVAGSGEGTYFCGGKAIDITWHKEDITKPFTYTLPDGTPFSLGIGKTYVCVVDYDDTVTVS